MRFVHGFAWCLCHLACGLQLSPTEHGIRSKGCPSMYSEPPSSCAAQRATRVQADDTAIVITSFIKDSIPADLVRQVEYHLLLRADLVIIFDNTCPKESLQARATADALEDALSPYILRGLVIFRKEYQCVDPMSIYPDLDPIGGSGLALQIVARTEELQQMPGTMVLPLDDDEYIVMVNSSQDLRALRGTLLEAENPSLSMMWRMYGSSGYKCQPPGAVVRRFTYALKPQEEMTEEERNSTELEAEEFNLNPPLKKHSKKFAVVWQSPEQIQKCETHNCPYQDEHVSAVTDSAFVAHYAYQSEQHWEAKKLRGRTVSEESLGGGVRSGPVPKRYSEALETRAWTHLVEKINGVGDAELRSCLGEMFGVPEARPVPAQPGA